MKGMFRLFLSAATAALIAGGYAVPADAQRGRQQAAPAVKLSKPVQSALAKVDPNLKAAQAAQQAGDEAKQRAEAQAVLGGVREAEALPNLSADDMFVINQFKLNAGILLADRQVQEEALEGMLASGRVPEADQPTFIRNIGALALQRNDNQKALQQFERLIQMTPDDAQLQVEVAELLRRNNQNQRAIAMLQGAIRAQEKDGGKADESWYRRALAIAYDSKLLPETVATSEALVRAYPNATNWRDVLVIHRENSRLDEQGELDLLRLMRTAGALAGERDFGEYAETAARRGLPGEAKAVLDEGVAKNMLNRTQPFVREIDQAVSPRIASDRNSLPGLEREARAANNGRLALGTADAHLGYGNYDKAAELYELALQKGGVDADTVHLRRGMALARAGNSEAARSAFKAVGQQGPRSQLARFWQIWLDNRG
ncbi:MAG: tetratricopeptide repeat protein [Thermaurantiacus sp.]